MKILILGVSKHKGEYEGVSYDYSKVFTVAQMEQSETKRGSGGVDMRATPDVYEQARTIDLSKPIFCEVETELRALGGGNARETVVSIKKI